MQYYTPYQKRNQQQPGGGAPPLIQQPNADGTSPPLYNTSTAGTPVAGGTAAEGVGRNFQPGQMSSNQKRSFGYLNEISGLGDAAWGTGQTFQSNALVAALNAMKFGMSTANPEDYAGMDEMRQYYRDQAADLPNDQRAGRSSLDTNAQRGIANMMQQYKNANAGRGTLGSRQYAGGAGDIVSRGNSDYINALIANRSDAIDQAGKINAGLNNLQGRDLLERQFQFQQGKDYAGQINNQQAMDMQRQGSLGELQAQQEADDKGLIGNLVGAYMSMLGYGAASGAMTKGKT